MRHIALQSERRQCLTGLPTSSSPTIASLCDLYDDSRAVLTRDGCLVRCNPSNNETLWVCNLSALCDEEEDGSNSIKSDWFSLTYVDPSLVCLNHSGAIVSVSPETGKGELVGEFGNGIEAGAWSPDAQVLLLVTFAENDLDHTEKSVLLTLNDQWEVLAEVDVPLHLRSSHTGGDNLSNAVSVVWRPDATLCAVSSVDAADQTRKVRIYKPETLQLHGVGRTEDGSGKLVPNLVPSDMAWAGTGCSQLLATIQRKGKKTQQVAFFEPNGLRHREFAVRAVAPFTVLGLEWNTESDIMAVSLREEDSMEDKVQLWHRSNYHWYLKREFCYPHRRIAFMQFHLEQPYVLFVALEENMQWMEYELRWDASLVDRSSLSSTAFVVDGCILNMTPLDLAVVPPPLSAATLTLPASVSEICFGSVSSARYGPTILLSDGSLVGLEPESCQGQGMRGWTSPRIRARVILPGDLDLDPRSLRHLTVVETAGHQQKLIGACFLADRSERLVVLLLSWDTEKGARITVEDLMAVEAPILGVTAWRDSSEGALVQLIDGQLLEYESGSLSPSEAEPLLEPCPWIAALKFPSRLAPQGHTDRNRLIFGMSSRGRFYCHDILLADSISSFCLCLPQQSLCYASSESRCQLRSLPLCELATFDPLMGSDEHHALSGYEPRNIERGARLVAVSPERPTATLQMPRGNLEVVYPRALVLRYSMTKILEREYKSALELMRKQKVDLNLIFDVDPQHFLGDGVVEFLDQVQNIDHLNLFISSLQNWDSTQERYPVPSWVRRRGCGTPENEVEFDFTSKINLVCQSMRRVMIEVERAGRLHGGREVIEGSFVLPILSTFAKEDPPRLKEALDLIKKDALRQHSFMPAKKPALFSDKAQDSIKYLAFLAEYELLFNIALGEYDYDMARAVARNSQMDPKFYLVLLKRYRELPQYYARYEVDMRLQRYAEALRNLSKSHSSEESLVGVEAPQDQEGSVGNSLEDCMALIREHGLHRLGLELFRAPPIVQRIMLSLGDRFLDEKKPATALNVFLACPSLDEERALRASRLAMDWTTFFALTQSQKRTDQAFHEEKQHLLAHDIANELAANAEGSIDKRWRLENAARVLLDYGQDVDSAVDMLVRAELWAEGQRVAKLHSKEHALRKCLEAAASYAQTTASDLEERSDTFKKSMDRFMVVLKIRKDAIAAGEAEDVLDAEQEENDTVSLFSVASNASNSSLKSTASTGSVSSLSSVISAKSTSSFSLVGADESYRHKSKFNQIGGKQKKRTKKKNKGRTKVRPGSQAELLGLVDTLQRTCIDNMYKETIAETITFLSRNRRIDTAKTLYERYAAFCKQLSASQQERLESIRQDKAAAEARSRRQGTDGQPYITLQVESKVDELACMDLPDPVKEFFSSLPGSLSPLLHIQHSHG